MFSAAFREVNAWSASRAPVATGSNWPIADVARDRYRPEEDIRHRTAPGNY